MATTNLKEPKRAEKESEKEEIKAKVTKAEKYEKLCKLFAVAFIGFILIGIFLYTVEVWAFAIAVILFLISLALSAIFGVLSLEENYKEDEKEAKRKESLINKLNKTKFKEIKLEGTDSALINTFFNNTIKTIKAKIHPDNDELIIINFCFIDNLGNPYYKSIPFIREDLLEIIDDVIESDNN